MSQEKAQIQIGSTLFLNFFLMSFHCKKKKKNELIGKILKQDKVPNIGLKKVSYQRDVACLHIEKAHLLKRKCIPNVLLFRTDLKILSSKKLIANFRFWFMDRNN